MSDIFIVIEVNQRLICQMTNDFKITSQSCITYPWTQKSKRLETRVKKDKIIILEIDGCGKQTL